MSDNRKKFRLDDDDDMPPMVMAPMPPIQKSKSIPITVTTTIYMNEESFEKYLSDFDKNNKLIVPINYRKMPTEELQNAEVRSVLVERYKEHLIREAQKRVKEDITYLLRDFN